MLLLKTRSCASQLNQAALASPLFTTLLRAAMLFVIDLTNEDSSSDEEEL